MHAFARTLCIAALAALAPAAVALGPRQEPPPVKPAPAPAPTQGAPQAQPQKIQVPPRAGNRGPAATLPVEKIEKMRADTTVAITTATTVFDLDLTPVDFSRDPLLLTDGEPVLRSDLDRELCLLLGSNEIEQFITAVLLRQIKQEMVQKGLPIPKVEVSEEEIKKKFDDEKQTVSKMQGLSPEDYEKQIRDAFGWEKYVEFQRLQLEFERMLLPDPPPEFVEKQSAKWKEMEAAWKARVAEQQKQPPANPPPNPPEGEGAKPAQPAAAPQTEPPPVPEADLSFVPAKTWEIMDARFVDVIKANYARGMVMHPLIRQAIAGSLRTNLLKNVDVHLAIEGDPDTLLYVGPETVKTQELLVLLSGRITDDVRRIALRELVNLRAADRHLKEDGALLPLADCDAALKAFEKEYETSIIPVAQAVRLYGFNSVWHYRPFFARKHSYQKLLERTTPEQKLRDHFEKAGRIFFESGTVITQVLFVPGTDRAATRKEMDALQAEIAGGKPFALVAREQGKFPDGGDVRQGSIAPSVRTKLRQSLGENEYIAWLTGYSMADEAFYVANEGATVGPVWRDFSPKLTGWLALHVDRFFTTGQHKTFEESKERVLDDLADLTFPRYVNEALARSRIEIPKK